MENIRQEKSNEGPILNIHKRYYQKSLNKTLGTKFEKSIVFKTLKK